LYSVPTCIAANGFLIEPGWLRVRTFIVGDKPTHRVAHFTDLHHKGNVAHLEKVARGINELSPDLACFTGDIVEDKQYLGEALAVIESIQCPVVGVPGNHEYWSGVSFEAITRSFEATGGLWIVDRSVTMLDGSIGITGISGEKQIVPASPEAEKKILLMHYPAIVDEIAGNGYDLILAGHSHGGQVRLPMLGAIIVPGGVGRYDMGLFQTRAGPMYVNPGIGYLGSSHVRFLCRPELTLIEF
jgi:predicted MPP superfamily phosphohydrolase